MSEGLLTLYDVGTTNTITVVCDLVPSITEAVSTSITRVPIVTFKADQAFAFDTGTTCEYSVTIVRTDPHLPVTAQDPQDPFSWSNADFEDRIVRFIDRWQAESDGCWMSFEPFTTGQRLINVNVYISDMTIRTEAGSPDMIRVTFNAVVGTMTGKAKPALPVVSAVKGYQPEIHINKSFVTMTSSDRVAHYFLYYGGADTLNCITSYTATCGPEQPFPSVVLNISKKNLSAIAPLLVDDIIPGKNYVHVEGVGQGDYIVTKISSSGQNYKVTAYSIYEQYRASPIGENFTFGNDSGVQFKTPMEIILRILTDSTSYGVPYSRLFFNLQDIIYCYKEDNNTWSTDNSVFDASCDAWYVLNVCALKLGCKIWFVNGKAYVVDTSVPSGLYGADTSSDFLFQDVSSLCLNREDYYPQDPSIEMTNFMQSVCGDTELGNEGAETLKNYVPVFYGQANNVAVAADGTETVLESRKRFGYKSQNYAISEIKESDAYAISKNVEERYCDCEQSVAFNLMETTYGNPTQRTDRIWQPYFSMLTRVGSIRDYSKDLVITNKSNYPVNGAYITMPHKLTLSSAEYHFPEGYTTYWFGVMEPTTLSQNVSIINSTLYSG